MANSMKNGKGVRIKYQTPCLFDLGSGIAYGVCGVGSSPGTDDCRTGPSGGGKCQMGPAALSGKCQDGLTAGQNCGGGGSAGLQCGGGGNTGV